MELRLLEAERDHGEFVKGISHEERMLITLRDEVYVGSWQMMLADLRERIVARPYIFKMVNRIESDLTRIERLQGYELRHKVNLADLLKQTQ